VKGVLIKKYSDHWNNLFFPRFSDYLMAQTYFVCEICLPEKNRNGRCSARIKKTPLRLV
jgi:hypothetical protein